MAGETENFILEILRGIRADRVTKAELAIVKAAIGDLRS